MMWSGEGGEAGGKRTFHSLQWKGVGGGGLFSAERSAAPKGERRVVDNFSAG